jgi:hypothetical protein
MTVLHSTLAGTELHELKGVDTAVAGYVPIADGAGNSSWGTVPGNIAAQVIVEQKSDLPAPVAGVITLDTNLEYLIAVQLDLGTDVLLKNTGSSIRGLGTSISGLSTNSSSPLITAINTDLRVDNLLLSNTGSGDLFAFTAGSASDSFVLCDVISSSYTNVGTFHTASSGLIDRCSFVGGVNGVTFTGTGVAGNIALQNARFVNFTGTAVDLGSSVLDTFSMNTVIFSGLGGSTSFSGLASSGNVTTRGKVVHCTFNGAGTHISTIDPLDLKWGFFDNVNIPDSRADAQGIVKGNIVLTTFAGTSTDGTNAVKVNIGTGFVPDIQDRFTIDNTGTITYIGLEDINVFIDITIFGTIAGGAARQYQYYIAKNSTIEAGTISKREYTGTTPGANSCTGSVSLSTGDTIELWVEAVTATTSLTVDTLSSKVIGK